MEFTGQCDFSQRLAWAPLRWLLVMPTQGLNFPHEAVAPEMAAAIRSKDAGVFRYPPPGAGPVCMFPSLHSRSALEDSSQSMLLLEPAGP